MFSDLGQLNTIANSRRSRNIPRQISDEVNFGISSTLFGCLCVSAALGLIALIGLTVGITLLLGRIATSNKVLANQQDSDILPKFQNSG